MSGLASEKHTTSDFTSQVSDKLGSANRVAVGSLGHHDVYQCAVEPSTVAKGKTEVAVKLFRIDPTTRNLDNLAKALIRELRVSLRLKHPNIVPLLGIARVESPLPAFISQWMPSGTLNDYLDKKAIVITPSARIELVDGIANGLSYLHSEEVVHGDIHPGNVLIDGSGSPRLTDFGFTIVTEHPELQWITPTAGRTPGSRWRAPEVLGIEGGPQRPNFKSDIYSFGSIAFFVVSGDVPWKGKNDSAQIYTELSKKATPARPDEMSHAYRDLIKQCWSWEPRYRPEAVIVLSWVQAMKKHPQDANSDFTFEVFGKLGSLIATGSFGDVYRCSVVESRIGRTEVAVKVFKIDASSTTDALIKAIFRGLKMWLKLKHPNIVSLFGTAIVGSPLPALVSQWMPSGTLSEFIEERANTITPSARYGLVKGIAVGLHYLHSENVIHGDLHPGNVPVDGSGNPCLTDFGLAAVAEEPDLQWNTMAMERNLDARWISPEVLGIDGDPERPSFKSDIYSFGSVMFFVVSGDVPWKEKYSYQICVDLLKRATPACPHNVGEYYWDLIQMCWSWSPRDRPDTTGVLQIMIEHPSETTPLTHHADTNPQEAATTSPTRTTKNIILFGEIAAAKSLVVNLLAGQQMATMPPDMEDCTMHWQDHDISFDGRSFKVFDTNGLDCPQLRMREYLDVIGSAHNFVAKIDDEGGIDLLVFCMQVESAIKATTIIQTNYQLFYEWLCEKKVPVVLVLTGFEGEQRKEDWWVRNKYVFRQHGMEIVGHCITGTDKTDGRHRKLYEESRRSVRELVIKHTDDTEGVAYKGDEETYRRMTQKLWELTMGQARSAPKRKDIEDVLIQRCGMPPEAARELAVKITSNLKPPNRQKYY